MSTEGSSPSNIFPTSSSGVVAKIQSENERGEPWKQSAFEPSPSGRSSVGTNVRTNASSSAVSLSAHQRPIS